MIGMKFINDRYDLGDKCKLCMKIDTKKRRRAQEVARINRWQVDGKMRASIDKAVDAVKELEQEINDLEVERQMKYRDRC